jgi:hypothetical protein
MRHAKFHEFMPKLGVHKAFKSLRSDAQKAARRLTGRYANIE